MTKTMTKKRRIVNIGVGILMVIIGIALGVLSNVISDYRIFTGFNFITILDGFSKVLSVLFICAVEWVVKIFGIAMVLFGGAICVENYKKMR